VESLVNVLRNQMSETGVALPLNMEMADLRNALSNQIQFNKQSALLAYRIFIYSFVYVNFIFNFIFNFILILILFLFYFYFIFILILFIYFLRVYEEGVKPPTADNILPRDEFPKVCCKKKKEKKGGGGGERKKKGGGGRIPLYSY
jgi:hypothetical protein